MGSPRSGTTMLFDVLRSSRRLASLEGESHLLWETYHPSTQPRWMSHAIEPGSITAAERRVVYWVVRAISESRRYLDKSPRNAVRVPYLQSLFPDASFVFLKRDGRATVSSLITGWRSESKVFGGVDVRTPLEIDGYSGTAWRFVAPPGWRAFATGHTLAEVCAFQWVAVNEALLDAREHVDPARWMEVAYERFVDAPIEETASLLQRLGLDADAAVLDRAANLDRNVSKVAVTPPRPDKWREEHAEEIERILPLIAPTMRRLGYTPGKGAEAAPGGLT